MDNYGCKGSAGYTWSVIKNDCIRIWEHGMQLLPINAKDSLVKMTATVIFSNDSLKAELFVISENKSIVLHKTQKYFLGGNFKLIKNDKKWLLSKRDKVIYVK